MSYSYVDLGHHIPTPRADSFESWPLELQISAFQLVPYQSSEISQDIELQIMYYHLTLAFKPASNSNAQLLLGLPIRSFILLYGTNVYGKCDSILSSFNNSWK